MARIWYDRHSSSSLPPSPFPRRDYRRSGVAVVPLSIELSHGRRHAGLQRDHRHTQDSPAMGGKVWALLRQQDTPPHPTFLATSGILMRWLSRLMARSTFYGGPSIRMVLCWKSLCKAIETPRLAKRLIRKLLTKNGCAPRVMVTDKLGPFAVANRQIGLTVCDHRQHKGLK